MTDPLAWAERAEEDYVVARSSLRYRKPLTYVACFHAQQCAEKHLKAILVSKGEAFAKTHDLLLLSGQCEKVGVWLPVDAKQLSGRPNTPCVCVTLAATRRRKRRATPWRSPKQSAPLRGACWDCRRLPRVFVASQIEGGAPCPPKPSPIRKS